MMRSSLRPGRFGVVLCAAAVAVAVSMIGSSVAGADTPPTVVQTFAFTGSDQTWTVPAGVSSVLVQAYGAQGGNGVAWAGASEGAGGLGGSAQASVAVTPGEVLTIEVGGAGESRTANNQYFRFISSSGGFGGGGSGGIGGLSSAGGGGGASSVFDPSSAPLVVAGGGGGGGSSADQGGQSGGPGGAGGLVGGDGGGGGPNDIYHRVGSPGAGGTQSAGGAGGPAATPDNTPYFICTQMTSGGDGTAGHGGAGGHGAYCSEGSYYGGGGGGGGGGYYGGGGGGGAAADDSSSSGGGGGSSYTASTDEQSFATGVQSGNGEVVLTYTAPIPQSIAFTSTPPSPAQYGGSYDVTATGGGSGNPVVFSIDGTSDAGACSIAGATVSFTGTGLCVVDANQDGNDVYAAADQVQQSFTIAKADPVLDWPAPAAVQYGAPLGSAQLDATASTPGSFAYSPAAGTVLLPGDGQTLTATFTPADAADWNGGSVTTTIDVGFSQACIDGVRNGPLTVGPGQAVCIASSGRVHGPVRVDGGSLWVDGGSITGPVTATGATAIGVCGATVTGPLRVTGTTGPVTIGDGASCAGNTITGPVTITGNPGGVTFVGNSVTGPVRITGNG